jgi:hypothetical protein
LSINQPGIEEASHRDERPGQGVCGVYILSSEAQVLENGIFVNWESAEKPVADNPTFRALTAG